MSSYTFWIPFQWACRLHVLQQGALNVGNTRQNIANLLALAITNANAGTPAGTWAKWSLQYLPNPGGVAPPASTTNGTGLWVKPASVPGFVKPIAS